MNRQLHYQTVVGKDRARAVMNALFTRARWFCVSPLPDDAYEFTVHEDNSEELYQLIKSTNHD